MRHIIPLLFIALFLANSCKKEEVVRERRVSGGESLKYIDVGKNVTNITFKVLKERLTTAMKTGGVTGAIEHCSMIAYPLTDSIMKNQLNVKIKRATHKARNPKNMADGREMAIIQEYLELMKNGIEPSPLVGQQGESMRYYAPIITLGLCLNCHGDKNKHIGQENYSLIKKLYPNDNATDFKVGDLRGIWSVEFNSDL